jgi:nucleoside-diphosphate-sugar epimerase
MIFLSTCSNYGISEEYCNENSTLNPLTIYSRTKVEAEKYILATNSNAVVVRSSTVFGVSKARTRMDIIPNQFLKEAIEHKSVSIFQPKAVRPIVHVGDSARIIKTLLESAKPNYQVYNIGYDELNHTKEEMANAVSEVVKSEVKEIESTDVRTYKVDFTRLHDEFELREPVTMKQGLVHLYNEIQARDLPLDCGNF